MSNELKLNLKPLCHSRCCTRQRYYSLNTQSLPEAKANSGGRWLMSGEQTQSHSRTCIGISKNIILNLKRDCPRCCTLQLVPTHSHTAGHPPQQFGRMGTVSIDPILHHQSCSGGWNQLLLFPLPTHTLFGRMETVPTHLHPPPGKQRGGWDRRLAHGIGGSVVLDKSASQSMVVNARRVSNGQYLLLDKNRLLKWHLFRTGSICCASEGAKPTEWGRCPPRRSGGRTPPARVRTAVGSLVRMSQEWRRTTSGGRMM